MPVKPVDLIQEAKAELQDSVSFYRKQGGERLVDRFKAEVASALRSIAKHPNRNAHLRECPHLRRVLLSKFPFSIIYQNTPDAIVVIAVAHDHRQPRYWEKRL